MDLLVQEDDVCGLRVMSVAELRKGGTALLNVRVISATVHDRSPGHWRALARQPGVVVVVVDGKSPKQKPIYMHTSDLEEGSIAAIEYVMKAGAAPKPEEDEQR
jgi:hypothetical protein